MSWDSIADELLGEIIAAGQFRAPRDLADNTPATTIAVTGQHVVAFASNDYLGLTRHPLVARAAVEAIDRYGTGAGSARLITGSRPLHTQLEDRLAEWRGTESVALFTTGFAANLGVIATLGARAGLICSDELNHASIIDGCRLARTPVEVYRHRDVDALDALLAAAPGPALVVSDTVFSMDGDLAPVAELAEVCVAHGALLVLDDAHVVFDIEPLPAMCTAIRVGTLSKTLGSLGGYAGGPKNLVQVLVNKARSYIFTTASTPADTAAAIAAVNLVDSAEGKALKARLRRHIDRVRPGHPSPIIPIVVGDEGRAVALSVALAERGILVPAIRPPTVPPGTSRLRLTVSVAHSDDDISRLLAAFDELHIDIHAT